MTRPTTGHTTGDTVGDGRLTPGITHGVILNALPDTLNWAHVRTQRITGDPTDPDNPVTDWAVSIGESKPGIEGQPAADPVLITHELMVSTLRRVADLDAARLVVASRIVADVRDLLATTSDPDADDDDAADALARMDPEACDALIQIIVLDEIRYSG